MHHTPRSRSSCQLHQRPRPAWRTRGHIVAWRAVAKITGSTPSLQRCNRSTNRLNGVHTYLLTARRVLVPACSSEAEPVRRETARAGALQQRESCSNRSPWAGQRLAAACCLQQPAGSAGTSGRKPCCSAQQQRVNQNMCCSSTQLGLRAITGLHQHFPVSHPHTLPHPPMTAV